VALNKSTAYHPQTDGQTECEQELRNLSSMLCSEKPQNWSKWLSLAEWWYNTCFHSAIQSTQFEVVYGQPLPINLPYLPGESTNMSVNRSLSAREDAIKLLKFHLLQAQNRMKQQADKRRSDENFSVGDNVFLKLHPYRQHSLRKAHFHKLLPKYYGPFKVLDKIGAAAYQLELPKDASIHNVFHVSQLKFCQDPNTATVHNIPGFMSQPPARVPECILDRKMVKRGRIAATKVLVQWKDTPPERVIWEFFFFFFFLKLN
jgi:hypothetical protein